jgi:hypothetical protein
MIPLPGLVILVWVTQVCIGVLLVSLAASVVAVLSAHGAWRAQKSAAMGERIAVIVLVPGLVCFVLLLPPFNAALSILSLLPALTSLATVVYIRRGNRRRGLSSLGFRGIVPVGFGSLAGSILLLFATFGAIREHQARERRLEEARRAAGRANQDDFEALVVTDSGMIAAGESSTPPAQGDDAWILSLDRSLALERRFSPIASADQVFFALTADDSGLIAGGRDDEHPVWVRVNALGDVEARRVWPWDGAVRALATLADGSTLIVGSKDDAPFVARVDEDGTERWSAFPDVRGSLYTVVTNGRSYLAAGCDDIPSVLDSSMVLVGGTTDGKTSWGRRFRASPFLPRPRAMAITHGGEVLVLGTTRDLPGRMEDLWLGRIAMDGTLLDEHTFGGPYMDAAGGLAVRDRSVYVAGYHFVPVHDEFRLLEVDELGNRVWERTYPAVSHGRPAALTVTREGDLAVAGFREGADLHRDGWIAMFDTTGRLIAQRTYP